MSDLIDRQNAIDALKKIMFTHLFECGEYIGEDTREVSIMNAEKALDAIENLPSAEPERKKGEWVDGLPYVNSHWWVCSICHVPAPENHTGYNFCPNCGARMTRGE